MLLAFRIANWWFHIVEWKRFLLSTGASVSFANGLLVCIFYSYQRWQASAFVLGFGFGVFGTIIGLSVALLILDDIFGGAGFFVGGFLSLFQLASLFKLGWLRVRIGFYSDTMWLETSGTPIKYLLDCMTVYLLLIPCFVLFMVPISHSIYRHFKPFKPIDVQLIRFKKFDFGLCCLGITFFINAYLLYLGGEAVMLIAFAWVFWIYIFKWVYAQLREQRMVKRAMHLIAYSPLMLISALVCLLHPYQAAIT
jgi:hypothetical protein